MKLVMQTRYHYGNKLNYPMCGKGKLLALLRDSRKTRNPTFRDVDLEILREVGFEIEMIPWDGGRQQTKEKTNEPSKNF
jgi:hypothetical protein